MLILLLHASLLLGLRSFTMEIQDGLERLLGEIVLQQPFLPLCFVYIGGLCGTLTVPCVTGPVRNICKFIVLAICLLILLPRTATVEVGVVH